MGHHWRAIFFFPALHKCSKFKKIRKVDSEGPGVTLSHVLFEKMTFLTLSSGSSQQSGIDLEFPETVHSPK
jgi:hypothetical protein